jgi:diguanylate cyclase (GGDEF)-like protein
VVRITKSLQTDKEKLRLKLNKAEKSYQKAAELALRDGLTGLYNYRALQEHIGGINNTSFAILLIDVDHFKEFNDQYGHMVGDQVLIQISQVILDSVRRSDKVFRYGGEEFAVVLEDSDDEAAMFMAERIRMQVASQTIDCDGQVLKRVTISIGVATFLDTKMPSYQMLEQADKALYAAKAKGRNNVVFFIEPTISI